MSKTLKSFERHVDAQDVAQVSTTRIKHSRKRAVIITIMALIVIALFCASLMIGRNFYTPGEVIRVILGEDVPGGSFTVGTLRLPRAVLAMLAGMCFGLGGVTFQTMLRNPLASPDIIGISSGASAAAAVGIIMFSLNGSAVFVLAISAALLVAAAIYLLSRTRAGGGAGTRLILVGIGVAAMLDSVTSYVLSTAGQWDLQEASRWLTGSLNGSNWADVRPVVIALIIFGPVLLSQSWNLNALQLGEETAAALGARPERTRAIAIITAVGLIAFATAASGPIAFVAFLSGPIAARIIGVGKSMLVPAALVGAILVLAADLVGQYALGTRFPVGVVTGVLGAPYLLYLIIRSNRTGGTL